MFPLGLSTLESEPTQDGSSRRRLKITFLGLFAMLAFGIVLIFSGNVAASVAGVAAFIIAIIALAALGVTSVSGGSNTGKRKRLMAGQDMYTLIDRMVDDLDEDEMAYLQRRLKQQEADLPQSVANLLDYREEERQAGRR